MKCQRYLSLYIRYFGSGSFTISLVIAMYSTYAERKVAAFMQDRLVQTVPGHLVLLQPLADGVKMFMKEEIIPQVSNKFLFILGPSIAMFTSCITGAVIPWGTCSAYWWP